MGEAVTGAPAARAMRWRYRAADAQGVERAGELEAPTERDVVDTLRRRQLWAVSVEPGAGPPPPPATGASAAVRATPASARTTEARTGALRRRLVGPSDATELAVAVRATATLLDAGVPVDRALAYAAGAAGTPRLRA